MSSEEQTSVVADAENAKKSDGPSTAGEHAVDKVNDDEQVPQVEEESTTEKKDEINKVDEKANNGTNKRDIDQVDKEEEKKDDGTEEEEEEEAVVSTTTTTSSTKKAKIMDPITNENGADIDETSSTSAKVPNEELTVV